MAPPAEPRASPKPCCEVIVLLPGKLARSVALGLLLLALATACRQEAPPEEDESGGLSLETPAAPAASGPIDPARVLDHLKANQLPIGRIDTYTAENDPANRLGRPGQYIAKAIFHDTRHPLEFQQDEQNVISFQQSGGVVEIYASVQDLEARRRALDLIRQQIPAAPPEYQYINGVVLIRLGSALTPDQAAAYEAALKTLQA